MKLLSILIGHNYNNTKGGDDLGDLYYLKEARNMADFSISDIAKAFLAIESMSHKKLQKLCYYAQAWYLVTEKKRLFNAHFEAWIHGPVSPELYSEYRGNGWVAIEKLPQAPSSIVSAPEVKDYIDEIYRIYGELDGDQLEVLTHSEKPWQAARNGIPSHQGSTNVIDENIMTAFYLDEFERSQNV